MKKSGKPDDNTYSYIPNNNDVITCLLSTDDRCATSNKATSNLYLMTVYSYNIDFASDTQKLFYPDFTARFINTTTNINDFNFTWDFGDSTSLQSDDSSVTHNYKYNGSYTVTLTGVNKLTNCIDSLTRQDYITCNGLADNIISNPKLTPGFSHYCFPNPASVNQQLTTILYNLPDDATVIIKIFD